ncbi:MAG: tyrosine-type recombinase/integrase [Planctomycetes bacterium]|nr:tyrosine-type recombinase/integrase [Planctomycetota bacterium]MCW8137029.1 tyrosine-type recombinase/integrase [Planctomycetota bacterium]
MGSRERAKAAAVAKSKEIAAERKRLEDGKAPTDRSTTWEILKAKHIEHLKGKGRSRKTLKDYAQSWKFLETWPGLPSHPFKLTPLDLQGFTVHLRRHKNRHTGGRLAAASVMSVIRHVKAIFNYGRKALACIKLDGERINFALDPGASEKLEPFSYTPLEMVKILEAAVECDDQARPDARVFPFIATLMLTGARRGELERLRWFPSTPGAAESSVDFAGQRLLIWSTKTRQHRVVPFGTRPALREILGCVAAERDADAEPFVFGGAKALAIADRRDYCGGEDPAGDADGMLDDNDETHETSGRSLKSALKKVRDRSGVRFRPKDCRSTLATHLANSGLGTNLYIVAAELGHDYAVLRKHYAANRILLPEQVQALTIEDLLGIRKVIEGWVKAQSSGEGRLIRLRRKGA